MLSLRQGLAIGLDVVRAPEGEGNRLWHLALMSPLTISNMQWRIDGGCKRRGRRYFQRSLQLLEARARCEEGSGAQGEMRTCSAECRMGFVLQQID